MKLSTQFDSILTEAKYIGVRQYYNYFINLYLIDDTFYEVWYFREVNEIEKIEKLDDEKKLNLYIDFELKSKLTKNEKVTSSSYSACN